MAPDVITATCSLESAPSAASLACQLNKSIPTNPLNGCAVVDVPGALSGSLVWSGSDYSDSNSYILYVTPEDAEEVDEALKTFRGKPLP
jgi:hypothetical protein